MTVSAQILSVAAGGALGAVVRYLVTLMTGQPGPDSFPIDTLLVNVAGCFLIGLAVDWVLASPGVGKTLELFLVTGLIGSFTTFSTFGFEFVSLLEDEAYLSLIVYVGMHLLVGWSVVLIGLRTGTLLMPGGDS